MTLEKKKQNTMIDEMSAYLENSSNHKLKVAKQLQHTDINQTSLS